jgi:hypothetical protein
LLSGAADCLELSGRNGAAVGNANAAVLGLWEGQPFDAGLGPRARGCATAFTRSSRPPTITARQRAQIVAMNLKPPGLRMTHWSTRDLARQAGVSHGTVHRLWQAHALQPDRVSTFKFTTDPVAEENTCGGVVGLYVNPPTNAVVAHLDKKELQRKLSIRGPR